MIDEKYIKAYTLKNAVEHQGKAVVGSVISGLFNHGLEKKDIKNIMPKINSVVKEINSLSLENQEKSFEKFKDLIGHRSEREGLPELENVKNGVVMRFSPSPSGPLHIGHIYTGMYSYLYVQRYGGKFYIQIEDTNPENIYEPAYDMIKEESEWLYPGCEFVIQSDRIEIYYKYLRKLFAREAVYVCTCKPENFKKLVDKKKACPCRNLDKKEQMTRWEKMLDVNGYEQGEAVVRFKSDINDSNPAMRDFPLARINLAEHPRKHYQYRVWPLMNLSVSVDDIELKKTHIIRGKDHRDNAKKQYLIYKALGLEKKYPEVYFIGRYNFKDLELSSSKTRKRIENGEFTGWGDIRLPTVDALKKRGYQRKAFELITIERGLSEVDKVLTKEDFFEVLDKYNREILKEKTKGKSYDFEKVKTKDSANIVVLMPDNQKIYGKSKVMPKKDFICYFKKFGYAKYNGKDKDTKLPIFWFCHK